MKWESTVLFGGSDEWPRHIYIDTEHACPCGRTFRRASGTTFLACDCGELRWLV